MNYNRNGADAAALAGNLVLNPASFHRLYEQQLRELWTKKYINATAYVLLIVQIHGKAGWKWAFKVKDFCKEWKIPRRTFYWAISRLKTDGMLQWEASESLTVWHGDADIAFNPSSNDVQSVSMPLDIGINSEQSIAQLEQPIAQLEQPIAPKVQPITPITPETLTPSESRQSPNSSQINFKSSSDLREEDLKLKEKEVEATQVDLVAPVKPAIPVEPVAPVEPVDKIIDNQPTSLLEKPKPRNEAINPVIDNTPPAQPIHSAEAIDKDFLLWVMEVKLPTLKLREQPINVEAYSRGMIRRDGDKLQAEYAAVVADQRFVKQMAELTIQVEQRVREWQKVSDAKLTAYHNLDGEPMVLLDGIEIGGADFLNKPIQVAPMVQTIKFDEEIRAQRPARMSRLKLAVKLAESPGIEFLQECWEDILLRSQVRVAIAKNPSWGVIKDGELQTAEE